jgi:hypothetical protein
MQTAKIAIHREQLFIDLSAAAALVRVIPATRADAKQARTARKTSTGDTNHRHDTIRPISKFDTNRLTGLSSRAG